jgi:hypothetical protein
VKTCHGEGGTEGYTIDDNIGQYRYLVRMYDWKNTYRDVPLLCPVLFMQDISGKNNTLFPEPFDDPGVHIILDTIVIHKTTGVDSYHKCHY